MGLYTALEVCLKMKYREDVVCDVSRAMFSCEDFHQNLENDPASPERKPWEDHNLWLHRLTRMFRMDGGTSFGRLCYSIQVRVEEVCDGNHVTWDKDLVLGKNHKFELACEESYVYLKTRSSYKGLTHWDFIEWVKPLIRAGFVRWKIEGSDIEDRQDFGPLPGEGEVLSKLDQEAAQAKQASKSGTLNWWQEKYAEGIERAVSEMRQT